MTQGEVDKAARISPLALCLVKSPAAELLQSMPVRDQRQLLADWAEATNLASTLTPLSTGAKKTPPKPATRDEGILKGLHLIMHLTIGLTGYIGPLTLTLTVIRSSVSP